MDSCIKSFDGRTFYATDFFCCPHCGATDIKKNEYYSFLLEAEANADKEDVLSPDRRDDSETGGHIANVARHGELSVKRGVSKNKLRIAVAVDDLGH